LHSSGAITAANGLTVTTSLLKANAGITATTIVCSNVTSAAITAASLHSTGAITAANGLTVSGGILTAGTITATIIYASSTMTANGGLTVGNTLTAAAITATSLYSSGAITINSGGLTVNAGLLDVQNINAGKITCTSITGTNIYASGTMSVVGAMSVGGTITCSSTINALSFNSTSDYRVKQFVQPILGRTVDSLNPVSYYNILSNKTDLGFIAHEVQPHFPMLVNGEKDGEAYQSINYTGLIPVLVAEIKDLKSQVKILTSKVEQLMQSI